MLAFCAGIIFSVAEACSRYAEDLYPRQSPGGKIRLVRTAFDFKSWIDWLVRNPLGNEMIL